MIKRDLDLSRKWLKLREQLQLVMGKKPADLNTILFLIGVQELGRGKETFSKEEKQDLIHLGVCKVLSISGYYRLEGLDKDGWPHWVPDQNIPHLALGDQEKLLKLNAIDYFENEIGLVF